MRKRVLSDALSGGGDQLRAHRGEKMLVGVVDDFIERTRSREDGFGLRQKLVAGWQLRQMQAGQSIMAAVMRSIQYLTQRRQLQGSQVGSGQRR